MSLATVKKALVGAFVAALGAFLSFNIPGWIDGSSDFNYRSVLAAVAAAVITYIAVYIPKNAAPKL